MTFRIGLTMFVLLVLCANAEAQTLYKCKTESGVTYADKPCSANAQTVEVKAQAKMGISNDEAGRMSADYEQRVRDIKAGRGENACLDSAHRRIFNPLEAREAATRGRIDALRRSMAISNNNAAGAQRDTGIQTEIAGLESSIATERANAASLMSSERSLCADAARRAMEANQEPKQ